MMCKDDPFSYYEMLRRYVQCFLLKEGTSSFPFRGKEVLPKGAQFSTISDDKIDDTIKEHHDGVLYEHSGVSKTLQL